MELWDRQPGETATAYHAFREYLVMEKPRVLTKLARSIGMAAITINKYVARYNWYERTDAYDNRNYERQADADAKRAAGVLDNKAQIILDELEDYQLMRQLWLKSIQVAMNNASDPEELAETLNILVRTRASIDEMARKAVELPSSYTKKVNVGDTATDVVPSSIELTMNGPKYFLEGGDEEESDDERTD